MSTKLGTVAKSIFSHQLRTVIILEAPENFEPKSVGYSRSRQLFICVGKAGIVLAKVPQDSCCYWSSEAKPLK